MFVKYILCAELAMAGFSGQKRIIVDIWNLDVEI